MKSLRFCANCSMLYPDLPFLDRFSRAAQDGFRAVEFMFPYEAGFDKVKEQLDANHLEAVLFNLPPGDQPGEWGIFGSPHRRDVFRSDFEMALNGASRLGTRRLHLMFGNRVEGVDPQAQIDCALENAAWAAPQAQQAGVTLTIEPINPTDFPNAFLHTTQSGLDIVKALNHPNFRLQYDLYHAQMMEGNLIQTFTGALPWIAHVQLADVPGRHQPGTGEIHFANVFAALERLGYTGYIGLEYRPLGDTSGSLVWMNGRRNS